MLRISYTKPITNTEVLNRVQQDRQLLNMIGKRQLEFFGHVIRKHNLEENITLKENVLVADRG